MSALCWQMSQLLRCLSARRAGYTCWCVACVTLVVMCHASLQHPNSESDCNPATLSRLALDQVALLARATQLHLCQHSDCIADVCRSRCVACILVAPRLARPSQSMLPHAVPQWYQMRVCCLHLWSHCGKYQSWLQTAVCGFLAHLGLHPLPSVCSRVPTHRMWAVRGACAAIGCDDISSLKALCGCAMAQAVSEM